MCDFQGLTCRMTSLHGRAEYTQPQKHYYYIRIYTLTYCIHGLPSYTQVISCTGHMTILCYSVRGCRLQLKDTNGRSELVVLRASAFQHSTSSQCSRGSRADPREAKLLGLVRLSWSLWWLLLSYQALGEAPRHRLPCSRNLHTFIYIPPLMTIWSLHLRVSIGE